VPAPIVPEQAPVLTLLERFRRNGVHMAVIVDEYGTTEGVVTLTDVLESIAGDLPERGEPIESLMVEREDGSWLVDGMLPVDEFEDRTGLVLQLRFVDLCDSLRLVFARGAHDVGCSLVWHADRLEVGAR